MATFNSFLYVYQRVITCYSHKFSKPSTSHQLPGPSAHLLPGTTGTQQGGQILYGMKRPFRPGQSPAILEEETSWDSGTCPTCFPCRFIFDSNNTLWIQRRSENRYFLQPKSYPTPKVLGSIGIEFMNLYHAAKSSLSHPSHPLDDCPEELRMLVNCPTKNKTKCVHQFSS